MQSLKYQITALSPILFSKESGDRNMTETFDHIPGRVILGIFAGQYIKKNNSGNIAHKEKDFMDLFLKDKVFFSNAYLKLKNDKSSFPTPFSIQSEKENPDVIRDLLFENEYKQTKPLGGFSFINEDYVKNESVSKSLNFHHSRDEKTGA
ncbi:MAG: hypothetical protein IPN57_08050 [Ignavibacteria bacterium]|nr:hypothetical protein [Ignavibacteria bacterium]